MKITIIIPTYNEAENLPKLLTALFDLPLADLNVLVVDDNSSDGTGQIADELARAHPNRLSVIHRAGKLGLGSAFIQGFNELLKGNSDAIGQMDADFSHNPRKVLELAAALETCDVAVGSRYVHGGSLDKDWPFWRKWLSGFGNFYARTILRLPICDTTGGFRLWRRETLAAQMGISFRWKLHTSLINSAFNSRKFPFISRSAVGGSPRCPLKFRWKPLCVYGRSPTFTATLNPFLNDRFRSNSPAYPHTRSSISSILQ